MDNNRKPRDLRESIVGGCGEEEGWGRMGIAHAQADKKGKALRYETGLAKDRKVFWLGLMELDV
jgi:hypothetical protein